LRPAAQARSRAAAPSRARAGARSRRRAAARWWVRAALHQHLFRARFYEDNGVGKSIAGWLGEILNDQPTHLGSPGAARP
jgi:hypothetical protein